MGMVSLTPAMRQYKKIKDQYEDCILMFRIGDFYEMFYEDAKTASDVLDITLTSKNVRDMNIPLAGVPYHSVDPYIAELVNAGHKVAVCEQVEDPDKAKGLVKRDVVRVVTPGTVMENQALNAQSNNFTMSIYCKENYGIALCDLSTGEFFATTAKDLDEIKNQIAVFSPKEFVVPETLLVNKKLKKILEEGFLESFYDECFTIDNAKTVLEKHFKVETLESFGLAEVAVQAAGGLLSYLKDTQKRSLEFITRIKSLKNKNYMILDEQTLRNLEILQNIRDGSAKATLLSVIDKTKNPMGARLLKKWIKKPLMDTEMIKRRLDSVEELTNKTIVRKDIVACINKIQDIERLVSKINYGNCNPRDLVSLKVSISVIPKLKTYTKKCTSGLTKKLHDMDPVNELFEFLSKAIKDEPAAVSNEGNIIRDGFNDELDELRDIKKNGKQYLRRLQQREREKTGIGNLKVKYNKVFGYFIEVTKSHLDKVPEDYQRKQTLVNSERYFTDELKEQENKILNAEDRIIELERELFDDAVSRVCGYTKRLQKVAQKIAILDVLCSLAEVSVNNSYSKPIVDKGTSIEISGGRHPFIEHSVDQFVPNDCFLQNSEMMIITGPNMSGKSTYMRQVALIVMMAQIGSFVPASEAKIGVVDRIFTRVGAYDDLVHGQSTFMVEMVETAKIVNNATNKSLIILDEIGRGTSTFDGVSIAWSVAEYIYNKIKAKTLFATHYHVLNKLEKSFENIHNYNIAVKDDDEIVFLRKIVPGGTDKSYGIHVAKIAGMPADIVNRAKEIQKKLEEDDKMVRKIRARKDIKQTNLEIFS